MKSLWWKEWRQTRVIILLGALLIIGPMPWSLDDIAWFASVSVNILFFVGVLLAAGAVSTESGDGTANFLLAMPVPKKTIWFAKLALRMLALCLLFGFVLLVVNAQERVVTIDSRNTHALSGDRVFSILCTTVLSFGFTFLSSSFIDKAVTSALAGIVLSILFLIGLNALLEKMIHPGEVRVVTVLAMGLICSILPIMGSLLLFMRREAK